MTYLTDLSEQQWRRIAHHFEVTSGRGRPPKHDRREIVNAILYITKSGCQWRMLPKDFPPWQTVYDHFSRWNKQGAWERALDELTRTRRSQRKKVHAKLWHR